MAEVTLRVLENGPILVTGEVNIVDANGNPVSQPARGWALCRCGGSMTKPFCDGTHSKIGFQAATQAVLEAEREGQDSGRG
ncbi:MAG: CDGSH iron-sulfur domain-containing protein [Armatimonadetes bacterium]|nr:CDGSH iron-sulfur domain-containing protein [Armatimonadota bacterium]